MRWMSARDGLSSSTAAPRTTMYFFSPAFLSVRALPMMSPSTAQKYMSPTVVTMIAVFHSASGAKRQSVTSAAA